jgi:hypothetical protein
VTAQPIPRCFDIFTGEEDKPRPRIVEARVYHAPPAPPMFDALTGRILTPRKAEPRGGRPVVLDLGQLVEVRYWFNPLTFDPRTGLDPRDGENTKFVQLIASIRGWHAAYYLGASWGNRRRGWFALISEERAWPFICALTTAWVRPFPANGAGPGWMPRWARRQLLAQGVDADALVGQGGY